VKSVYFTDVCTGLRIHVKKQNNTSFNVDLTLSVLVIYFTIALSYIFFLPCQNQLFLKQTSYHNSIFKREVESLSLNNSKVSFIKRPDKSTFEESKTVADLLSIVFSSFILLFFIVKIWELKSRISYHLLFPKINYQYT
jgi:hypothetical protein